MAGVETIGTLVRDELIASGKSAIHTRTMLIKGTTALTRGQLIGKSSTGDYRAFTSSDTPVGILCEDMTPTTSGVNAIVYVSGHFNANKITGYTADVDEALRDIGIFADKAMAY